MPDPVTTPCKAPIWLTKAIEWDASDKGPESHLENVVKASHKSSATQSSVIKPQRYSRSRAVCTITDVFLHTRASNACSAWLHGRTTQSWKSNCLSPWEKLPGTSLLWEKRSFSTTNRNLVPRISRTRPLAVCSSQAINVLDHKKSTKPDKPPWQRSAAKLAEKRTI